MKKLALVFVLVLAGCAGPSNPLTTSRLYALELTYKVALETAVAYRERPLCPRAVICSERSVVLKLQAADRKAQVALAAARRCTRERGNQADCIAGAQSAVATFSQQAGAVQ